MNFESEITSRVEEGKEQLAYAIKLLLYQQHPELFDLLDFENDRIFLEPLLYTYYNFPGERINIPQVLFGYIEPNRRPAKMRVQSDANGIIYLPNFGYLETRAFNTGLDLHYSAGDEAVTLKDSTTDTQVRFEKIPLVNLPGTDIEILRYNNASFANFFESDGKNVDPQIQATFTKHNSHLQKAFAILEKNCPFHYRIITDVIRKVVLYNSNVRRSFASIKANGAAFFNVKDQQDEVYLLEDITHQCGHVVYYFVLWDKEEYFRCDASTPLCNFTGNVSDKRTVLGGFYSLLPFALSNSCSSICWHNQVFNGHKAYEFEARYAFRMNKFLMDVRNFDNPAIFTEKGWALFELFKQVATNIHESDKDLIERFDISNQGYEFDLQLFKNLNSRPQLTSSL